MVPPQRPAVRHSQERDAQLSAARVEAVLCACVCCVCVWAGGRIGLGVVGVCVGGRGWRLVGLCGCVLSKWWCQRDYHGTYDALFDLQRNKTNQPTNQQMQTQTHLHVAGDGAGALVQDGKLRPVRV
jgi:hypothetical protein